MSNFRLRKAAGGSTLRGGDTLKSDSLPAPAPVPRGSTQVRQVLAH
jgi:hypothetical protein